MSNRQALDLALAEAQDGVSIIKRTMPTPGQVKAAAKAFSRASKVLKGCAELMEEGVYTISTPPDEATPLFGGDDE